MRESSSGDVRIVDRRTERKIEGMCSEKGEWRDLMDVFDVTCPHR